MSQSQDALFLLLITHYSSLITVFMFLNLPVGLALLGAFVIGALFSRLLFSRSKKSKAIEPLKSSSLLEPTEQAASTLTLAPAEPLLRATMNGMREGVLVINQAMRVVAANRAAREIFGRVEGALEQKRLSELTRNSAVYAVFRAALEQGERAEVKVEMRDANLRIFDLRVAPLRLHDKDDTRAAIGVFFDITQLERLERVRQEFLSNVSHELRTPLTAILAFVETLEDGALEDVENNRRFLSVIRKNATRMHNLIDDILELSAIEAGNVQVVPAPVRLHSLSGDVLTALASHAAAQGVSINNEIPSDVMVYADARRLEQMLTNLVDNAIKFNRTGGVVTISLKNGDGERDRICVADTGDGIPAEHIERIFERFYRVDRARSREMGGTGLGLAIVKHLARAHGGEVSVQSKVGEGSTFVIELPRVAVAEE
jgi:two-component system phosphate regulon sensor histidine kinase PhoR